MTAAEMACAAHMPSLPGKQALCACKAPMPAFWRCWLAGTPKATLGTARGCPQCVKRTSLAPLSSRGSKTQ